ncbi:MAG TPA: hypothetical protein VGR57_04210, partial [Ktedonobacterales bacterium]|nr:hypothetical protein [Ktedonobacterales bacterium]
MSDEWMPDGRVDALQWERRDAVAEVATQPARAVVPLDEEETRRLPAPGAARPAAADPTGALVRWPNRKPRHRRDGRRRVRRLVTLLVLFAVLVGSGPLVNSPIGAKGADLLRAVLGPRLTAQIES